MIDDRLPLSMPKVLSEEGLYIDGALARLTAAYRTLMLESHRTESALVAEYLVDKADDILDLQARARTVAPLEAERLLTLIHDRIGAVVRMRRPR